MRVWITVSATNSCAAVNAQRNSTPSTAHRHADSFFSAADIAISVAIHANTQGINIAQLPPSPTSTPRIAPMAVPSTGEANVT